MRLATLIRTSPAVWAAPIAIGLPLLYYLGGPGQPPADNYGYAPTITSYPLMYTYPFAYAVASALGVWVSGTLRQARVWEMNYTRSRYRIAAHSLLPVVGLAWLTLIIPPALALMRAGVWPTWDSVSPLAVGMVVSVEHAVIGFAVGLHVPRIVAAPVIAIGTWVAVAFTITVDEPWVRHVSGQHYEPLEFGEAPVFAGLWPHVAFTGSVALAVALLWVPTRRLAVVYLTAVAVALGGTVGTYEAVKDYSYNPPLKNYAAAMTCKASGTVSVCMPSVTSRDLTAATVAVSGVLQDFRRAGLPRRPEQVIDTLPEGRFSSPSTASTWRVPLSLAAEHNDLRFAVALAATGMDCSKPDPFLRRVIIAWTAHLTGTDASWQKLRASIDRQGEPGDVDGELKKVLSKKPAVQAAWFTQAVETACAR
ncbi:hypothetical protein ACIHFB_23070 [Streptomyces sp. NPDC051963]|uniref:hypothetical protein n=1 Tax=Streptomyces sp. NPDC051963 TaxID=3365678 RepID=UPI0037D00173